MIPEELLAENLHLDMMFLNFFLGNSQVEEKKRDGSKKGIYRKWTVSKSQSFRTLQLIHLLFKKVASEMVSAEG